MVIGRMIGWLLLLAALAVLGRDLIAWYDTGVLAPIRAGELWFDLYRPGLDAAQAAVRDHLAAWLWDPVATAVLSFDAFATLAVPGIVLLWLFRVRRTGGRSSRRRHGRR